MIVVNDVKFTEQGTLISFTPKWERNIPACGVRNAATDKAFKTLGTIHVHPNGTIKQVTLAEDFIFRTAHGTNAPRLSGSLVSFDENGTLLE